jgi:hypothetical protein
LWKIPGTPSIRGHARLLGLVDDYEVFFGPNSSSINEDNIVVTWEHFDTTLFCKKDGFFYEVLDFLKMASSRVEAYS